MSRLTDALKRLRTTLSDKADEAYVERDEAESPFNQSYADGEAHAYGIAADAIRNEQNKDERRGRE